MIIFPSTDTLKSMWHSRASVRGKKKKKKEKGGKKGKALTLVGQEEPQLPLHAREMRSGPGAKLKTAR